MRRVKALLALILAVLWLPVTMHCALEGLPGLEFLICCAHDDAAAPHEDDDCQADACAVVESGFYKIQDQEDLVTPSADVQVLQRSDSDARCGASGSPGTARPTLDLAVGWQFSLRAAPLPRAPSSLL